MGSVVWVLVGLGVIVMYGFMEVIKRLDHIITLLKHKDTP